MRIVRPVFCYLLRLALCCALAFSLRPAQAQSGFFSDPTTYYDSVKGVCPQTGQFVAGTGETTVGEPIDVATGAMMVSETFCTLPGRIPFAIGYTYRNLDNSNGPMGKGTSLTTDYFLRTPYSGIWELICPGNRRYLFYLKSGSTTVWMNKTDPEALGAQLTFPGSAGRLLWRDGTVFQFAGTPVIGSDPPKNSLIRIIDRHGNGVTIQRYLKGFYATRVTDDRSGAYVDLSYTGIQVSLNTYEQRLTSVTMKYSATDTARSWTISGYAPWYASFTPPPIAQFATVTDPRGGVRTFQWGMNGNTLLLTKLLDPRNKPVVNNSYDANKRVAFQYVGAQTSSDATMRYTIEYAYFSDHTTLTYRYINPNTNLEETQTETYYFTKNHYSGYQITKHTDTLGDDTTYAFNDPQGRFLVTGVTYHGRTSNFVYDNLGNVTDVTTPRVSQTNPDQFDGTMTFHANYNATFSVPNSISFPGMRNGSNQQISRNVQFTIDPTYGDVTDVTDPRGKTIHYNYTPDGRGDMLSATMTVTDSNGQSRIDTVQYQYPLSGAFGYDTGKPSAIVDPTGNKSQFTYDNRHRLAKISDRNSTTAIPHEVQYLYNDMDQVTQVIGKLRTNPYQNPSSSNPWITTTTAIDYTNTGQISKVTDPIGNFWSYQYDERDRLASIGFGVPDRIGLDVSATTVSRGTIKYFKWTPDDQLLEYREEGPSPNYVAGRKVRNVYLGNGQLQKTTFSLGGSTSTPTLTYTYDPTTHLPTAVIDSLYGTQNFTYDALERLRSFSYTGQSFTYTYDDAGRLTRNTFQNGGYVSYAYDDNDNLIDYRTDNSAPYYSSFTYDELGRMIQLRYPDASYTDFRFDSRGFLAEENTHRFDGASLYRRGYVFDNVGNVKEEYLNGILQHTYQYDDLDRLIRAQMTGGNGPLDFTYYYDLGGNRTSQIVSGSGGPALSYSAYYGDANRITNIFYSDGRPNDTIDHDVSGNITRIGSKSYQWNARGELVGANNNVTTYTYDPFGRRNSKQSGINLATFLWDGWNLIVDRKYNAATNPPTQTEDRFMWEFPGLPDMILNRDGTLPVQNRRGDTAALFTGTAIAPYATFEYAPYGETIKDTPSVTLDQYPYRFAGREDDGNGLYYLRNRYYSPVLGRFMSEDPIGFLGGTNLYAYGNNNPVTFSDPFGLYPVGGTTENPWFDFTLEGTSAGLQTGLAATASALSFDLYDGGSFKCQPGFGTSHTLATIGREAALAAATLGESGANVCLWKGCFTGDTLVLMADGSAKPISEIQYGDLVLTKSDATGLVEAKPVVQKFQHRKDTTVFVHFDDGSTIHTTAEHPFFVSGAGWIPAGRLAIGNAIVTRAGPQAEGKSTTVTGLATVHGRVYVYNFAVEDGHTYFVGDGKGDWKWVHNAGCNLFDDINELGEIHHIMTNKSQLWTPRFAALARRAGVTTERGIRRTFELAANRVRLSGHAGPHTAEYHRWVWRQLRDAIGDSAGTKAYDAMLNRLNAIKNWLYENPHLLDNGPYPPTL